MKINRNDLCPCGSGKKYKKCCLIGFELNDDGLKYVGNSTTVFVPEYIDGKEVSGIAEAGFFGKHIKKVILPDTIKVIGKSAFADCKELIEVVIPDSVTNIKAWAFGTCTSLKKIKLSDNIVEIGSHAFDECCNLEFIELPREIDYIGAYAFSETGVRKVVLSKGIKYLGNSLFYNCRNLNEVILEEGIEIIGSFTFGSCSKLKKVILPDSVKIIREAAFDNCLSLKSIRIPKNLEEMHDTSFNNCSNLETIETDDINRKIIKFDHNKQFAEEIGFSLDKLNYKEEYNTIYNMLKNNTNRKIKVIPINKSEKSFQEKYEDILNEGVVLKKQGRYEEAKNKYIQAIKMGCKISTAYYNLGKILYILGDFEASARAYLTSFELGIDSESLFVHLGHALLDENFRNGKFDSVILAYEEVINPYSMVKYVDDMDKFIELHKNPPTIELIDKYESKCIKVAKEYLSI